MWIQWVSLLRILILSAVGRQSMAMNDVHVIQGVLGEVEVSSYWSVSIIAGVKSVVCESLSKCL